MTPPRETPPAPSLGEIAETLEELGKNADRIAPETSGHDGLRFTLGYTSATERNMASAVLSRVEHGGLTAAADVLRQVERGLAEFFESNPACDQLECGHFGCDAIRRLRTVLSDHQEGASRGAAS